MAKVTDIVSRLALPVVEKNGCSLYDVEYVREGGVWFLRLYIDKDGGVNIDDCEVISRAVSDLLDEADPIQGSYTFEVSSAGADRVLRTPEHFAAYIGQEVEVRLFRPRDGQKSFVGPLASYEDGAVTVSSPGGPITFEKQEVAQVRLFVHF